MRFDEVMELALYHPIHGYYASAIGRKIGRKGDFYTSVSVGDTFGLLLSHTIEQRWLAMEPEAGCQLVVVEQGAHDLQLARDILAGFAERQSPLLEQLCYRVVAPRESSRVEMQQIAAESDFSDQLEIVESLADARAEQGVYLCNELLDAFAVRRLSWRDGQWHDSHVIADAESGQLRETYLPATQDAAYGRFLQMVEGRELPDGYTTEYCPGVWQWTQEVAGVFAQQGCWLVIDYGLGADSYFRENRTTGTLKAIENHQSHEAYLRRLGELDLTAHVNWSDLAAAGEAAGLSLVAEKDQCRFLTRSAESWLLSLEGQPPSAENAQRLRQFQTLTHPEIMGRSFQVVEFSK